MQQGTLQRLNIIIIMGTILLFPFVVWDGLYSSSQLPKLVFLSLSLLSLSLLGFFTPWKISKREATFSIFIFGTLLIFFIWNVATTGDKWISIVGSLERYMGFMTYSFIFLFVFLMLSVGKGISFYSLSRLILGVGVGLSILALGQKFGILGDTLLGDMIFEGRAMSTIGQYNTFGAFLLLPIGLGLTLWKGFQNKLLMILILLILFCGIWTTGSRTALIGGITIMIFLLTPQKLRTYLILLIILIGGITSSIYGRLIPESGQASIQSRMFLFADATSQIGEFTLPEHLLGRGFESIQSTLLKVYSPKYLAYEQIDYIPDRSHNIFLDTYIQFGIVGSMLFLLVFLLYPFILFLKGDTLLVKNYGVILLVHFGVLSVGFYDIVNLFFATIIIGNVFFTSKKEVIEITKKVQFQISLVLVLISICGISLLINDVQEQQVFIEYRDNQDDLLQEIQESEKLYTMKYWNRDDLIAKELGKSLGDIARSSDSSDALFKNICKSSSYHILQTCVRFAYIKGDFGMLREQLDKLKPLAPYDIVMLSLKMELAKHEGDKKNEKQFAKQIVGLFPTFVLQDDSRISEYQKRKKDKIFAHYPIKDWIGRAK